MRTSYFSRAGKHPDAVAICRGIPKWYTGKTYQDLAPSWGLVKETDMVVYEQKYMSEVLAKLDPQKVLDDLMAMSQNPILLCYEKPEDYCHRHLVAKWLRESLGVEVIELE